MENGGIPKTLVGTAKAEVSGARSINSKFRRN